MRTGLGLGLVLLSVTSYFMLMMSLGIFQRYPVPHYLGAAIGLFTLARQVMERRSLLRVAALAAGIAVAGLFAWYTLDYSSYAPRALRVQEGQTISALTTLERTDHEGRPQPVLAATAGSRATLLVFYRGFW